MMLTEFAREYVRRGGLAKNCIYAADRFAKEIGNCSPEQVSQEQLNEFRRQLELCGLSAWTVRGHVKDVCTLVRASGGAVKRPQIRTPDPVPDPVPIEHIDAIWPFLAPWSRQFVVLSWWTCLRLADVIRLQKSNLTPERLEWRASKTGRFFRWPVPEWLKPWLQPMNLPYANCRWHNHAILRAELDRVTRKAGIDRVLPSMIRSRALSEWARADYSVARLQHGCGLGVMSHYIDRSDAILSVANRVRMPACFEATAQPDDMLLSYRRLDPESQQLVGNMIRRLAQ